MGSSESFPVVSLFEDFGPPVTWFSFESTKRTDSFCLKWSMSSCHIGS
uniref:Uncharacterized protein n=1 Tax=Arundo donax TaxID=35708 RepID=A0A0A9ER07_ARUDO